MNLKKIGKVLRSKSVGAGPSSYEKRIYLAAASQRLRNTGLDGISGGSGGGDLNQAYRLLGLGVSYFGKLVPRVSEKSV